MTTKPRSTNVKNMMNNNEIRNTKMTGVSKRQIQYGEDIRSKWIEHMQDKISRFSYDVENGTKAIQMVLDRAGWDMAATWINVAHKDDMDYHAATQLFGAVYGKLMMV